MLTVQTPVLYTHPYLTENLFGNYLEKGNFLEKRGISSTVDPDIPTTNSNRYVVADITSFFTLLVGIYFPSVTGDFGDCSEKNVLSNSISE